MLKWIFHSLKNTSVDKKKSEGQIKPKIPWIHLLQSIRETFPQDNYAELSWNLFEESAI